MDVKEILQQVAHISSGLDNPALEDSKIHLQYLNLVHLELYRLSAEYNPAIAMQQVKGEVKDGIFAEPLSYYSVSCVYDLQNKNVLVHTSLPEIIKQDPLLEQSSAPKVWCNYNNRLMVYPKPPGLAEIALWYKSPPQKLTLETEERDIPYPAFYHQVLVDGAAYYAFQSETGLRNKTELALAMSRWELGKRELLAYFTNMAGLGYKTTYTEV